MAIEIDELAPWRDSLSGLEEMLKATRRFIFDNSYDPDPASPYQQARQTVRHIFDEVDRLVVIGFQQVDQAIADSDLVAGIEAHAAEAKREAEAIKRAAATIGEITAALNKVTAVIEKLAALPFIGPLAAV